MARITPPATTVSWLSRVLDSPSTQLATAIGFGVVVGAGLAATWASLTTTPTKTGYVLIVTLKVKPGCMKQLLALWKPLADYCKHSEDRTLSYEAIISDEEEDTVVIFERYVARADLAITHYSSAAFKQFGKSLTEAGIVLEKSHHAYIESNVGFMTK